MGASKPLCFNLTVVRRLVDLLYDLLDAYFTSPQAPTAAVQRFQKLYSRVHNLLATELGEVCRHVQTWSLLWSGLPTDDKAFAEARIAWRRGASPFHDFYRDKPTRNAEGLEPPLTSTQQLQITRLEREVVELRRIADGVVDSQTPSTPPPDYDDNEALERIGYCFDRPAFCTPSRWESSFVNFHKAITDTIESLNTGVRRLRDGTFIERIKSRHELANTKTRSALARIVEMLIHLRSRFEGHVQGGRIPLTDALSPPLMPRSAGDPVAYDEMDRLRAEVLESLRKVVPSFVVRITTESGQTGSLVLGNARTGVPMTAIEWSAPKSSQQWARAFGVTPQLVQYWFEQQDGNGIRIKEVNGQWCVGLVDIPSAQARLMDLESYLSRLELFENTHEACWNGVRLHINTGHDFTALSVLRRAKGDCVAHSDLGDAIKPSSFNEVKRTKASPEVKEAVSHIRSAFRATGCPIRVVSDKRKGYRLAMSAN